MGESSKKKSWLAGTFVFRNFCGERKFSNVGIFELGFLDLMFLGVDVFEGGYLVGDFGHF
jgi:hypothetical protein